MSQSIIASKIIESKVVAILRMEEPEYIVPTAKAIKDGGIRSIEVSLNTPDAMKCISDIAAIPGIIPGVGTVTTVEMAKKSIEAGAEFVVTPITKKEIIDACHELGKPVISGAFSPGEIYQAHEWGADIIKVFPAFTLGMEYLKAVKTPFPQLKLMPTGGINTGNIDQWIENGADLVGVGGGFTNAAIVKNKEWEKQTMYAKELLGNLP